MRVLLMLSATALMWRYLIWRFTDTVPTLALTIESMAAWGFASLEAVTVLSSSIAALILCRTKDRSAEATQHQAWWSPKAAPRVDIYIATYNEDRSVLERTIAGAIATTYSNSRIFVLDDGRRLWLQALCNTKRVGYLTRDGNAHAKAGNMNSAFWQRRQAEDAPDFIAVLDADFIPHRDFLDRSIALFHDEKVGLVQTPQYFFNPDPIQHNLGITSAYPDEQRFFFNHVEAARDAWGIAVCCGTSSIVRASALNEIGGFPTESVTEDFLLTLKLSEHGYKVVYLNEPLTEGLAPEGLQEYIVQRGRWCLGMMQIVRGPYNPLSSNNRLSFLQRVSVADSLLYWSSTFPFRLASILCPLLYWYFGVIVVDASVSEILIYFTPAYAATLISLNWLSRGLIVPLVNDVAQLISAYPITRAVGMGLFTEGPHKFDVTAKGGDRSKTVIQWPLLIPFAVLFGLTIFGLCFPLVTDYSGAEAAGDGKAVIIFWTLYNLVLLGLTMLVCVERPRPLHSMRRDMETATLQTQQGALPAWVLNISRDEARVRGPQGLAIEEPVTLELSHVGQITAVITAQYPDGYLLHLLPSDVQADLLTRKLHTEHGAPGVVAGSIFSIFAGIFRRLVS
ncbi:MAG: glycosyltransferase [Chitinophagales bacterium]|nr:glycosyltransferase [Hyphomicrobiales bacterium]